MRHCSDFTPLLTVDRQQQRVVSQTGNCQVQRAELGRESGYRKATRQKREAVLLGEGNPTCRLQLTCRFSNRDALFRYHTPQRLRNTQLYALCSICRKNRLLDSELLLFGLIFPKPELKVHDSQSNLCQTCRSMMVVIQMASCPSELGRDLARSLAGECREMQ